MRTEIEIQKENVQSLLDLIKENPELKILPMIDAEIVADDTYGWWAGSFGKAEIDHIWNNGERIYFKSGAEEDLIESEIENIESEAQILHESHPLWRPIEERAAERVEGYGWEKVIVVWIGLPQSAIRRNSRKRGMNVSKLEEMGTILMHIALQYTHPDFESMYSDWSTVHDIGEKLVKMSDQPQLNENQQIVVNDVKQDHENYGIPKFNAIHLAFTTYATGYYKDHLKNDEEFYQVLSILIAWALEQEAE